MRAEPGMAWHAITDLTLLSVCFYENLRYRYWLASVSKRIGFQHFLL
jgi:hypothetical protein